MRYSKLGTKIGAVTGVIALAVNSGGYVAVASAQSTNGLSNMTHTKEMSQRYRVNFQPLNNSGVSGTADIILTGRELTVSVRARGLTPNMIHAQHIHGQTTDVGAAECPTSAQDINKDNFISVTEGAPTYGPIKLNLTNPQTPFGPNNTVLNAVKLFTDFAGMPAPENFPKADAKGNVRFTNTYLFDTNDAAANAAFETLNPLTDQEVVLHGAVAPINVETATGGGATMAYDDLLPVACARITAFGNQGHQNGDKQHGQGNEGHHSSISNTGPGSNNSIRESSSSSTQTSNNNQVNISNQNNQTATSGNATSSGDTASSGYGSDSDSASWDDMNPTTWQTNGQGFGNWWSRMNVQMTQYNANHWTLGSAANNSWAPAGDDWQSTWSNWNPELWQANGQSYGNWYAQMLSYMTGNYSDWMQNWDNDSNAGDVSTGDANNNNSSETNVNIDNASSGNSQNGYGDESSIDTTGIGSTNTIESRSNNSSSTTNDSDISVSNDSSQTAESGNASSSDNTFGGNASTGSAGNSNNTSDMVSVRN